MNNKTMEKLNYTKLKELVKSYCVSSLGKELIDKLKPSSDIKQVNRRLEETSEGRRLLDASYHIPLEGVFNINPLIEKMDKGGVLEPSELVTIGDFLRGCRKIKNFIKDKEGYAETLSAYGENITSLEFIEDEINISIKGSIVDSNASKELRKIRNKIDLCEGKIKEKLERFIKNPSNKEALQEFFVSERNGKFTVPIKASYKNKIDGTIIETSSKGNTVFIEPSVVSKYSYELVSLKAEESIEEYKILAEITEMIYGKPKEIKINIEVIAEYDMIMAKAKYSKEINGIKPKLNEVGYIKIVNGIYPLIKNPVPLNFEIGKSYRSLIITGPNAGGKTVVLKTVGLLTLAVQSGFHIEADEGTEIAVFNKIFVDIGDDQSIENALSTFSTLEPLYKLHIGKSGDSNALYIAKKMGISNKIIERTKRYIEDKDYNYDLVEESKLSKDKTYINNKEKLYEYKQGDKVILLDNNKSGIVYKERDRDNNLIVMVNKELIKVNYKRIKLEIKAKELYPEGYDMNQLFVSFKERKLERDIERGSKKALKKIRKDSMK